MRPLLAITSILVSVAAAAPSPAREATEPKLTVKDVVLSERPSQWIRNEGWITVSQDSRYVAYRAKVGAKWRIVRDGVPGKDYDEARDQWFGPGDKHWAYVARDRHQWFVILDGAEGKPYSRIFLNEWPFEFSPDSDRLAYAATIEKGRECVVVDGVQGPIFDRILPGSFQFSGDSRHFAYAACRGGRTIVVRDGNEVLQADDILSDYSPFSTAPMTRTYGPYLSPDGQRLACFLKRGNSWFANVDGAGSAPWDEIESLTEPEAGFSPDGRHFTYVAKRKEKTFVVIDQQKYADGWLASAVFSPDGKRAAFVRAVEKEGQDLVSSVVLNGVAGKKFRGEIEGLVFSPNGKKLAYKVRQDVPNPPNLANYSIRFVNSFVVVHGGEEFHGIHPWGDIIFSPDSKHMAFCGIREGRSVVVLDGKELPKGDDSSSDLHKDYFEFSPDSKRWAYIALRNGKKYAVISGMEYGPYDYLSEPYAHDAYIYFSLDSRHFAFQATRGTQQYLVVDGIEHEIQGEWLTGSFLRFDSATKLHGLVMGKEYIFRIEAELVAR